MSVFKRTTSRGQTTDYHYRFMHAGTSYYGVCEGCTTERDAAAFEKRIKNTVKAATEQKTVKALVEHFRDELTDSKPIPIAEAYDRYLAKPKKRTTSEAIVKLNRAYWNDFAGFMNSTHPDIINLADVTRPHAEEYINLLRTSGAFVKTCTITRKTIRKHRRRPTAFTRVTSAEHLAPRTINIRHTLIKAVFAALADDAGLVRNPFNIPTLRNTPVSREAFSPEELRLIHDNMSMPVTKPVFTIGLCTGLTLGDICLLRWDEIQGNWITNKRRRKTGAPLEIPILPMLAEFLEQQRPITGDGEYVVPELAEMFLNHHSSVINEVREFLEGLGIKTTTQPEGRSRAVSTKAAHAMRHTFAYLAGVTNIPLPIVQSVLGHMTPAMTELYQKHATREVKEKFFNTFPVLGMADEVPALTCDEPERAELHRLTNALPLEAVKKILEYAETLG